MQMVGLLLLTLNPQPGEEVFTPLLQNTPLYTYIHTLDPAEQ